MKTRNLNRIAIASGLLLGSMSMQSCDEDFLQAVVDVLTYNGNEYASNSGDNYFGWFGLNQIDPCNARWSPVNIVRLNKVLSRLIARTGFTDGDSSPHIFRKHAQRFIEHLLCER